ncbi:Tyrosyl-tRNA synthetase [Elusimicrobium minutum Pei191]|uniref:Tyrosine--tRNA ligase n=1 Tax=Elusimicrobium minutum (strain Pei191) TaxID=445932 RepID=B2KD00_ELUMP|nr:tyrosine--tRNA ligase [Elusimicrobium minutum]ACC98396.1 Tyrosyl-tRNA synthetase [Elusimicrobium minutum Pei191]
MADLEQAIKLLTRGCVDVVSKEELENKLKSGRTLKVKLGCDPTSSDLHLGHSVVLSKLRQFQDLGHTAVLVIGDFTAGIGDPSGRNSTRPQLDREQILQNAKTYTEQVFKVLDKEKTEVVFNSTWLDPFVKTKELLLTLSKITVRQGLEREDFKKRMAAGDPVSILEILYSVFQGQDSVALKADVELGGTDQIFNLLVGRQLQKNAGQEAQVVLTTPLLVGTDGVKKMSKSYNNYIGLNDPAEEMFGKAMSISDEMMYMYYELLTSEDMDKVKAMHPMEAKKSLAKILVTRFHNAEAAEAALNNFEKVFSKKEKPADMSKITVAEGESVSSVIIKAGAAKSKNEARRLIDGGAVKINDVKVESDGVCQFETGNILQVGRRHFFELNK